MQYDHKKGPLVDVLHNSLFFLRFAGVPNNLAKFTKKHVCWSLFFYEKENPTQVFLL